VNRWYARVFGGGRGGLVGGDFRGRRTVAGPCRVMASAGWPVLGGSNEYSGRPNRIGEVEDDR
jgi:hypothetical protein